MNRLASVINISVVADSKHSEVNVKRDSSSFHSNNHSVSNTEKSSTPLQAEQDVNISSSTTWPIYVRLSNNGQDITIQVPTQAPYLTVAGLKEALLPHLEKDARVRLIYLGRILPDQHMIVPTETDDDIPLPPPKKRSVLIQKEGVIQAMITKCT